MIAALLSLIVLLWWLTPESSLSENEERVVPSAELPRRAAAMASKRSSRAVEPQRQAPAEPGAEPQELEEEEVWTPPALSLATTTVISGHVSTSRGAPITGANLVILCDVNGRQFSLTEPGGNFNIVVGAPDRCRMMATRSDGWLHATSDWVELEVGEDGLADVGLVLPHERTGGIGVTFETNDEGVLVTSMLNSAPAANAGLEVGDLIVEVDGEPVTSLKPQQFVKAMTGAEGTEVQFTVGFQGDTGWTEENHVVIREFLSKEQELD